MLVIGFGCNTTLLVAPCSCRFFVLYSFLPTMEYELVFIGFKEIGIVEKLVGEVAMRSSKEGY